MRACVCARVLRARVRACCVRACAGLHPAHPPDRVRLRGHHGRRRALRRRRRPRAARVRGGHATPGTHLLNFFSAHKNARAHSCTSAAEAPAHANAHARWPRSPCLILSPLLADDVSCAAPADKRTQLGCAVRGPCRAHHNAQGVFV